MPGKFCRYIVLSIMVIAAFGCGKSVEDPAAGGGTGGGSGSSGVSGKLAAFNVIPLPTVSTSSLVIPNLSQFHVTNRGPYVQIQNSVQQKWSVYKYQGGSGSAAWSSFTPSFTTSYYRPTSMFYEKENSFSIYWCNTNLTDDKYGMFNLNTGTTSFEFQVPGGANGPYVFSEVIPPTAAVNSGHIWAIVGNEIWRESAVAVPKKFNFVLELPSASMRLRTDAIMADPDVETDLWVASGNRLYQVSEVGNPVPPYGKIKASWDFSSVSSSDRVQAIIKVGGKIVIQFGNRVYMQNGASFNKIGDLNVPTGLVANICTNGTTIYAADGTYYDTNSSTWKSFIGSGANLSGDNAKLFAELQNYMLVGAPIGCVYGSASGPVYVLVATSLIQVTPML